ncbi:hypothetical protein LIER_26223 [Lithospermum erythrorhizon]|uniref:NADH:quinone oxidoreductase/Mrp antiporter transmembrane domain-containing protein n=1 Tax=Lithospermum erythrorhizon TaxID=34254 RepID=A0AAV3RAZ5_LITER
MDEFPSRCSRRLKECVLTSSKNRASLLPRLILRVIKRIRIPYGCEANMYSVGATLDLAQKDIKRGLAYSTMSQLGYMMLALGGSYFQGVNGTYPLKYSQ